MSAKLKEFGSINCYDQIFEFLNSENNENGIRNYIISISGYGDLICFGYEKNLVIASLNYIQSKNSDAVNFLVTFQDIICDTYSEEQISSILVIPVASQKQSSQGFPDWNCICLGLTTGLVKFYDQNGQLIFTQKFHNEKVEQIQLHGCPSYNNSGIMNENLMILYSSCCFQIDGSHLYESLNMFKKQLARIHAGFLEHDLEIFQLSYKKWLLDNQENVTGAIFCYEASDCVLDNIFIHASNKGPFASVSDHVSKYINCATVGKNPFILFYRLPLEADSLNMGDLAHAVYSKVKGAISSSFSSWLGTQTKTQPTKKSDPSNSEVTLRLQHRHSIEEFNRKSSMIIGCPQFHARTKLAAVTDNFGRVFLIDVDEGTIIRMWKGYRDAQISITTSSVDRHVNFLIIYAPRRSIIEIWTIPFGEKVVTFDIGDRKGRLIHVPHRLLGYSRSLKSPQKLGQCFSTFFLDSAGKLFVIEIPFHLSLVNSSNERSQDLLVLKHFKNLIKDQNCSNPDLNAIRSEISLSIGLLKLSGSIHLLMNTIVWQSFLSVEFLISIYDELFLSLTTDSITLAPCSSANEISKLRVSCQETLLLMKFYKSLKEIPIQEISSNNDNDVDERQRKPQQQHFQDLESLLNLDIDDCERIHKLFDLYSKSHHDSMFQFSENENFHLLTDNFSSNENSNTEEYVSYFQLAKHVPVKTISNIGFFIFNKCLSGKQSIEEIFKLIIDQTKIDPVSCFKISVIYLIHESMDFVMFNLTNIKQALLSILNSVDQRNQYLQCLTIAEDICEKSTNLINSLLISMTLRVVICEMLQNLSEDESVELISFLNEALDTWNITCQRLEDLAILDCLLKCRPLTKIDRKKKIKVNFEETLTLARVLEIGKGIFSESFAKWALKWELKFADVRNLYRSLGKNCYENGEENEVKQEILNNDENDEKLSLKEEVSCNLNSEVKEVFSILYKQLPHSLEYDSVLINLSWEYSRLWSKNIQKVEYLLCVCELLENVGPGGGLVIQGVGGMIWDMHLKTNMELLFSSDQNEESGNSATLIVMIVTYIIRFLTCLLNSLENLDVMPTFSSEFVWKGDKFRSSLIELAVTKDPINEDSVNLHIQLLNALQLVALVNLQGFNCKILYNSETRKYFFDSLSKSIPSDLIYCDLAQSKSHRMRFLERIISSSAALFSDESVDNSLIQNVNRIIKILINNWQMDPEEIRQSWIINYYKCALDSQAAMYIDRVENKTLLAANLLRIVGLRIKKEYLSPRSKNYREYSKYVTPSLGKWFQNLVETNIKEASLFQTNILIDQILEWLPENSLDFETGTCLQSLILNIEKTKKYVE